MDHKKNLKTWIRQLSSKTDTDSSSIEIGAEDIRARKPDSGEAKTEFIGKNVQEIAMQ